MIKIHIKIIVLVLMFYGCQKKRNDRNQFSSLTDTLVIQTQKQKGDGLFLLGASPLNFTDSLDKFSYDVVFPESITEIKRAQRATNFKSEEPSYIDIMSGIKEGEKVFVVDENNNNTFEDDSVRVYKKIKWFSSEGLIKCKYLTSKPYDFVEESTWLKIGMIGNSLYCGRSEHLVSNLKIEKEKYQLGVIDLRAGDFTYGIHSEIALLSDGNTKKDTLLKKDILKLGESLKLNGNYYRFESISGSGEQIKLVKEKNFKDIIGTQLGMIAPSFEAVSIYGDTINSKKLNKKITVIMNACGCGGDIMSTKAYYNIENYYSDKIHLIALDSKIEKNTEGLFVDVDEVFNKDIYNKYRKQYCSRTCYVIGKNNRIIDKFEVTDWESNLSKLIN